MVFVTRKVHFNAAHRLHNAQKSENWNEQKFGKCNHINWHGHNYELFVTVAGQIDPDTGYVIDLNDLKQILEDKIISKCDHKNLNLDVDFLQGVIPSSENLVRIFFEQLEKPIYEATNKRAKLYSVKLYETPRNSAEYNPYTAFTL